MKSKKITALALSLAVAFTTVACSNSTASSTKSSNITIAQELEKLEVKDIKKENKGLSEKQVFENIKKSLDNTKSVSAKYEVKVSEIDKENKEKTLTNIQINSKIIYSDKKDKEGLKEISKMYDSTNIDKEKHESYIDIDKNKIYLNQDGKGLKEYKQQEMKIQTESSYMQMAKMFLLSANLKADKKMTMTETDKTYDFKFTGKNGDLFYLLDGLFNIGIDLNNLDKAEISITYKISKKDFSIIEVIHEAKQSYDNKNYLSTGKFELVSLNDIKEIEEAKNIK